MAASVVECAYRSIHTVHDDDGIAGIVPPHVAAWLRDLVDMSGKQPAFAEHMLLFERVIVRVGVAAGRHIG